MASFDNIAELCEKWGIDNTRSYFFSKECLIGWTMLNRWTWRDRGIRMNCISPGPVDTPILGDFVKTLGDRAKEDMEVMDRVGTPADIAPIAAFLCSDVSRWIRGANIPADGGMSAHIAVNMNGL
jgi:NAD(P)-dependent dehydrogenase (short-subunit alcohol dehydrogenase family)